MGEGSGDGTLEATGRWLRQFEAGRGAAIESGEGCEKTRDFLVPGQRGGVAPFVTAVGEMEGPIEKVAHAR